MGKKLGPGAKRRGTAAQRASLLDDSPASLIRHTLMIQLHAVSRWFGPVLGVSRIELVSKEAFPVEELSSPDDNLEAVFHYLVEP